MTVGTVAMEGSLSIVETSLNKLLARIKLVDERICWNSYREFSRRESMIFGA